MEKSLFVFLTLFAILSFYLANLYSKYIAKIERERISASFNLLQQLTNEAFARKWQELGMREVNVYSKKTNYLNDRDKIHSLDRARDDTYLVKHISNAFDQVALAIKYGVIDEDMAYDQLIVMMSAYWRWVKPYVLLGRMFHVNSTDESKYNESQFSIEFEQQIYNWEKKREDTNLSLEDWRKNWQYEKYKMKEPTNGIEKEMTVKEWVTKIYYESKGKGQKEL